MALISTATPTVSEDPHRPGIPDEAQTLAGFIDLDTIADWGQVASFAHPQMFDVEPASDYSSFDMGDGTIYRYEPGEDWPQRIHEVGSVSGVSLASDSENFVYYTAANEFEVHDADEPPSDQSILVAILDTSTNTVDTDVRGRTPFPIDFLAAAGGEGGTTIAPIVTTGDADSIADTEAELSGTLDSLGGASSVEVYIQWREQGAGDPWSETTHDPTNTTGSFNALVDGLTAGTTYEFRAVALNTTTGQVGFGATETFTTTNDGTTNPVVTTDAATNITASSADLNGELTDLGDDGGTDRTSVDVFFDYESVDGSEASSTGGQTLTATGTFSETENGLREDTRYRYRAAARTSEGTVYGSWVEFSTAAGTGLAVTTDSATNVGSEEATLNGTVTSFGGANSASVNFNYRPQGDPTWDLTTIETITTTLGFVDTVDQLVAGTTYEYQARASTSTDSALGTIKTFTTSTAPSSATMIDDFEDGDTNVEATNWNGWIQSAIQVTSGILGAHSGELDTPSGTIEADEVNRGGSNGTYDRASAVVSIAESGGSGTDTTIAFSNTSDVIAVFTFDHGTNEVDVNGTTLGTFSDNTAYQVEVDFAGGEFIVSELGGAEVGSTGGVGTNQLEDIVIQNDTRNGGNVRSVFDEFWVE